MTEAKKPSEKILANSYDGKEVTDAKGRVLRLRKPDILDLYDLMSAIGEDAKNEICQSMAINVLYVATIDNLVVQSPKSYGEFRATLQRIGEHGFQAIAEFRSSLSEEEQVKDKGSIETAKK